MKIAILQISQKFYNKERIRKRKLRFLDNSYSYARNIFLKH